jgi:CDP-diacylglycerol---serine O-phosphatidyltransferase
MDKTKIKRRIHLVPNVITAFGLSCGLFVIFKMCMTEVGEVNYSLLAYTGVILLLAAFADLVDGMLARAIKAESDFGGLYDSMSDAITFGVAPSIIVLKTLSLTPKTELSYLLTTAALIFSVCGVLRLVRFNIHAQLAKEDAELVLANKKNFTGLPIPAAAAALVSTNLLLVSPEFQSLGALSPTTHAIVLAATMIILGYFMISRWKFFSLKAFQVRVASFQVVLLTTVSAALIFYGILHHFAVVFAIFTWAYILVAWVLSIVRIIAGRRVQSLEDFEPEPEDFDEEE